MTDKTLSPQAAAIRDDLRNEIKFADSDSYSGDSTVYDKHAVLNGLEVDTITKVKDYDRTFGAGLKAATSEVALDVIKANESKKEAKFEATFKTGHGEEMTASFVGFSHGSITGKDGEEAKPWVKYGSTKLAHKSITHGKRGDLGAAQEMASAAAEALLKG